MKIKAQPTKMYAVKAVLGGKFIGVNTYINKEKRPHINNLTCHLKTLKKRN